LGGRREGAPAPTFERIRAFANQGPPINVLPFEGVYEFLTSISLDLCSVSCERIRDALGGSGAGVFNR
jgi:hypothetical protein